ncbi:MAG: alpha-amylase [Ignavibacteriae bacterium]|nr:alpha-amylase [Ignavibacteriota bacterium]
METALNLLEEKLKELLIEKGSEKFYKIPSLWIDPFGNGDEKELWVSPYEFYLNRIIEIRELAKAEPISLPEIGWTKESVVYNIFVRNTTSFDHNSDGIINIHEFYNGFRETGTFLKTIGLLPYMHSLGVNTIYFLPITSIGVDGKKGTLGSPYAIKNPYKLDDNLSEPALGISVEDELQAFVEAAHLIGMKVIIEFVFRTASVDSELALEHPDWFYWLKEDIEVRESGSIDKSKYGPPIFSEEELVEIKYKVEKNEFNKLPSPPESYLDFFTETPDKVIKENNKITGITKKGEKCKIPSAFADWPPDDTQPVWSDVTYLKLFNHPDFNYIAYNTVRMYDEELSDEKYKVTALWENVCNIIPNYQKKFNIDGVMIDMGHALPSALRQEIVNRAKMLNPNFVFWEENFLMNQKSVEDGYEAVVGYLCFDMDKPDKVKEFIGILSKVGFPIPFFGTPETHNLPRAATRGGGVQFSKFAWTLINLIPGIPFIHSGFELGETYPVNTGLCFEPWQLANYPSEKLPLFSEGHLSWTNKDEWTKYLRKITGIRKEIINPDDYNTGNILNLHSPNNNIIAFIRKGINGKSFMFIGNMNPEKELFFYTKLPPKSKSFRDIFSGKFFQFYNDEIITSLKPFEIMLGELEYKDG